MERVGALINELELRPIPNEALFQEPELDKPVFAEAAAPEKIRRPTFPGGLRIAHLHYKGELYLLDDDQWHRFAGGIIIDGMRRKLERTKFVNFEQAMELADVLDVLP